MLLYRNETKNVLEIMELIKMGKADTKYLIISIWSVPNI